MKTEATLQIEKLLRNYYPTHLGGQKLNKHRSRHLAFECVVECGSTLGGIVDCVRIDETLTNERRQRCCGLYGYKDKPFAATALRSCETSILELPELCNNTSCHQNSYMISYDNEILITCFEIKVTKADFHSSHGHNFCGNANYYAMPKELYDQVMTEISEDIGVVSWDGKGSLRRVKDCKYRKVTAEAAQWLILNVLKKNRVQ